MFSNEYGPLLLGLIFLLLLLLGALLWIWKPWMRVGMRDDSLLTDSESDDSDQEEPQKPDGPRLTVIVYAENGEEDIERCVEMLEAQDYSNKEIVVVCRATAESRELISGRLSGHENVYVTFIPPGTHNLSERKLAITLGLKAATGDIVLTTAVNVRPASDRWLSAMAAPFSDPAIEIVTGYSHMDFSELRGPGRWYRQFDSVMTAGLWIGSALAGNPYRGDGFNLAFRRSTFFEHKGYARNMFLHYGDDDLFVNEIARADNSAMVMDQAAIVTTEWGPMANRVWTLRKSRYNFTSRWLPQGPFIRASLLSWCNWLLTICAVAMCLIGFPDWAFIAYAAQVWLIAELFQILYYRRLAARLQAVRLWWAVPVFLLIHPVLNFIFRLSHRSLRKMNYTWQR